MRRQPLADRLRPTDFSEIAGQKHLFGSNGSIMRMISSNYIPNMIFWGPPGTGKDDGGRNYSQPFRYVAVQT